MYKVEYLPIALRDMVEIAEYISFELSNPMAADRLSEEMIEAGNRLVEFPYSYPAYIPIRPLKHEYRKLLVQNYILFYWVDEEKELVTIARAVYAKMDYERLLK